MAEDSTMLKISLTFITFTSFFRVNQMISAAVTIAGELMINDVIKLTCSSTYETPLQCSATFLVQNATEDILSSANSTCFHTVGACQPTICSCSDCQQFVWYGYKRHPLTINQTQTLACHMRFQDKVTGHITERTAVILNTGKDFIPVGEFTEHVTTSEDGMKDSFYVMPAIVVIVLTICALLFILIPAVILGKKMGIIYCELVSSKGHRVPQEVTDMDRTYRKVSIEEKGVKYVTRATNNVYVVALPGDQLPDDSAKCGTCLDSGIAMFCKNCKTFYCSFCALKHLVMNGEHSKFLIPDRPVKEIKCDVCLLKHLRKLCIPCKMVLCGKCDCTERHGVYRKLF